MRRPAAAGALLVSLLIAGCGATPASGTPRPTAGALPMGGAAWFAEPTR